MSSCLARSHIYTFSGFPCFRALMGQRVLRNCASRVCVGTLLMSRSKVANATILPMQASLIFTTCLVNSKSDLTLPSASRAGTSPALTLAWFSVDRACGGRLVVPPVLRFQLLLSGPNLIKRVAFKHLTVLHHVTNRVRVADVL